MTASTVNWHQARSIAAEQAFRARVAQLGGEVLESQWLGSGKQHRVRCKNGHVNMQRPYNVLSGWGICRICAGRDRATAEAAFRARVAAFGGQVVGVYVNKDVPVDCVCRHGHPCSPRPATLRHGHGMCRACAGKDPVNAEVEFRRRVTELGGRVVGEWKGCDVPLACVCAVGHACHPMPTNVQRGQGICRTCVGQDSAASEAAFRARVAELGGEILEPEWLGSDKPHRIRCRHGHVGAPCPSSVQQGAGICRTCAGKTWDAFYVVVNPELRRLKFGITSGGPRRRLSDHRRAGYTEIRRALPGLLDAHALERNILATLRDAGIPPVQGWEYYHLDALPVVLAVADGWVGA